MLLLVGGGKILGLTKSGGNSSSYVHDFLSKKFYLHWWRVAEGWKKGCFLFVFFGVWLTIVVCFQIQTLVKARITLGFCY